MQNCPSFKNWRSFSPLKFEVEKLGSFIHGHNRVFLFDFRITSQIIITSVLSFQSLTFLCVHSLFAVSFQQFEQRRQSAVIHILQLNGFRSAISLNYFLPSLFEQIKFSSCAVLNRVSVPQSP